MNSLDSLESLTERIRDLLFQFDGKVGRIVVSPEDYLTLISHNLFFVSSSFSKESLRGIKGTFFGVEVLVSNSVKLGEILFQGPEGFNFKIENIDNPSLRYNHGQDF